ncbi:MAG: TIGR03943 family protein [Clostridiales bacterium]
MKELKSTKFNIDSILKIVILAGFASYLLKLVITDEIKMFVHPRIIPYIIFSVIIMLLLSVFLIKDIFKPQRKKINFSFYLFFFIPLFMAYTLPISDINSDKMSYSSIKNSTDINDQENKANKDDEDDKLINSMMDQEEKNTNDIKLVNNTIEMNNENFMQCLDEISINPKKYINKKVTVTAFVFKGDNFKENEFVPARFLMTCCMADLTPVGLLANYEKANLLNSDKWYEFSGTIIMGTYNKEEMPIIKISNHKSVPKPTEEYIYPY